METSLSLYTTIRPFYEVASVGQHPNIKGSGQNMTAYESHKRVKFIGFDEGTGLASLYMNVRPVGWHIPVYQFIMGVSNKPL